MASNDVGETGGVVVGRGILDVECLCRPLTAIAKGHIDGIVCHQAWRDEVLVVGWGIILTAELEIVVCSPHAALADDGQGVGVEVDALYVVQQSSPWLKSCVAGRVEMPQPEK